MYSIVCVSLSYDTRNVFSLFSVKYMGSCPLNRKIFFDKKKKYFWVILALFENFEAKRAKNGSKNQKTFLVNVF